VTGVFDLEKQHVVVDPDASDAVAATVFDRIRSDLVYRGLCLGDLREVEPQPGGVRRDEAARGQQL
jgi:hypothetical protein